VSCRDPKGSAFLAMTALLVCAATGASDYDELRVKREPVFEFAEKPTVTRRGDRVEVRFATKGHCDVTVAIEDETGRIVRHLASGVLGPNAPKPFRKNAKAQTIVWDGKDDAGTYIDDTDSLTIRVSLGLNPQFERTLYWSPYKRPGDPKGLAKQPSLLCAAPEGVYVYETGDLDWLRLFDHDGNYVRTVYPFPAKAIERVSNLKWHTFPDGRRVPLKWGLAQVTLLTCGSLSHGSGWPTGGGAGSATAMDMYAGELFLARARVNRIAVGDRPAHLASGPPTALDFRARQPNGPEDMTIPPQRAAVSANGKWLYLTGYHYTSYHRGRLLHGVVRVALDKPDARPELFVGVLQPARVRGATGDDDAHFCVPADVASDAKDRLYVADWGNDRIQVFSSTRTVLKTIKVRRPARVRICPKTGDILVFSWAVPNQAMPTKDNAVTIQPTFTHLGPFEDPTPRATFPVPANTRRFGSNTRLAEAAVDFWTDPPTIWLARNKPVSYRGWPIEQMGILLLQQEGRRLVVKRDFMNEAKRKVTRLRGPRHARQRLFVNPKTGRVYVGEHHDPAVIHVKSITELVSIDPDTGRVRLVSLPFDAEDLAFDVHGRAYLRTLDRIARYDLETGKEVPFDYGEERPRLGYHPLKTADVRSATGAVGFGNSSSQMGGMCVSPKGRFAVVFHNPSKPVPLKGRDTVGPANPAAHSPQMFPGRVRAAEIHVWDDRGRFLHKDAFPGIASCSGINMDEDDNLYVLSAAHRIYDGKPYFNDTTGTLIKVKPGQAKVLSGKSPTPLPPSKRPQRPPDLEKGDLGRAWVVGAEWLYGGVGMDTKMLGSASRNCHCIGTSRPALDYFARSFLPEIDRCSVVVVDKNGNTITRIGQYGNVQDGQPLIQAGGPRNTRSIGGDEVALFWPNHVATHTDRRLFVADVGNARIVSVRLDYHATERVRLSSAPDQEAGGGKQGVER